MTQHSACTIDPYLREIDTQVLEVAREGDRLFAVLADTVLYAEGGGQPADHGWVGGTRVDDVQLVDGIVRHYLQGEVEPGAARVIVDWVRRHEHMQHHTGQHLLSALLEDRRGWMTTSFHLGAETCDIELAAQDGAEVVLDRASLNELEEEVAVEIRAARPVRVRAAQPDELETLGVRSRGLPPGHTGSVRLIEIEGLDLNTCGGTHLRSTAEIESMHLLATERTTRATRLHFVCGRRLRRRLAAREEICSGLRALLKVQDREIVEASAARLEQLSERARRERLLIAELADRSAAALAAMEGALAWQLFPSHDGEFLRQVAQRFQKIAPDRPFLIAAGEGEDGAFQLSIGSREDLNVKELGTQVARILVGRGGGSGRYFQGKAAALSNLERAATAIKKDVG